MGKEYRVVRGFLDTLGGTSPPVFRPVGGTYPPDGVYPSKRWIDYLATYRTASGEPILEPKTTKSEEAPTKVEAE